MAYTPEQLSDLEDIRQCAVRYCRGVDRLDPDVMRSAYWPDATDNHGTFNGNAWDFVEHCMVSHKRWRATTHNIMNHAIELEPNGLHARGEIYNVTYLFHTENRLDTWHGRYLDLYEKRKGEWRIAKRTCVHEGSHTNNILPMQIQTNEFVQGVFDRESPRAIGPV